MTYGMKYMLTLLVQEVVEANFQVRDIFASWLDAIEESIEDEGQCPKSGKSFLPTICSRALMDCFVLLRRGVEGGAKEPIGGLSVQQPAALCFC